MKIVLSSSELHNELQLISRVLAPNNSVPILNSILFDIRGDVLHLIASDGDTRVETSMPVKSHEGPDLVFGIKSKLLLDPIRELPEQDITFDVNETDFHTVLYYLNGQFVFRADAGDVYPDMKPAKDVADELVLSAKVLDEGLACTHFSTSNDLSRPITMGVYLDAQTEGLTFVGTDGFLMSMYTNFEVKVDEAKSLILGRKPAQILRTFIAKMEDDESPIKIKINERQASFEGEGFLMRCSLIAGKYPKYRSVIPKETAYSLLVNRELMLAALRRVSMFSDKTMGLISLELSKNEMVLKTRDIDFSISADEKLEISYNGPEQTVNFRANHLIDVLTYFDSSDTIEFKLGDKTSPGLISPSPQPEHKELTALVMPLMS